MNSVHSRVRGSRLGELAVEGDAPGAGGAARAVAGGSGGTSYQLALGEGSGRLAAELLGAIAVVEGNQVGVLAQGAVDNFAESVEGDAEVGGAAVRGPHRGIPGARGGSRRGAQERAQP